MSSVIPYPSSCVWYIRVSSKRETGQGSGVGVRLRKNGQPGSEETFILTCAHVVRRSGKTDRELGPVHENLWVYPAGYGYNESDGIRVAPVASVTPLKTFAADNFYNLPVEDVQNADWVLLEFADHRWKQCRDQELLAPEWCLDRAADGNECIICGYPDGDGAFKGYIDANRNVVRPKPGYTTKRMEIHNNGIIQFDGVGSREGMSGGGAFRLVDNGHNLCGLHRERSDPALKLLAVSIIPIFERLRDLGYEPSPVVAPSARQHGDDHNYDILHDFWALTSTLDLLDARTVINAHDITTRIIKNVFNFDFFEVQLRAEILFNRRIAPGLKTFSVDGKIWSSHPESTNPVYSDKTGYTGQTTFAFDQNKRLWLVAADEAGSLAMSFENQWDSADDIPQYWQYVQGFVAKTSIVVPLRNDGVPFGMINMESKNRITMTPALSAAIHSFVASVENVVWAYLSHLRHHRTTQEAVDSFARKWSSRLGE